MFWWFDPETQRVECTHPFTSNVENPGYFTVWPLMQPSWWSPWTGWS